MIAASASATPLIALVGMTLVLSGAAIQVAIGAGLSVVCGSFLFFWLGVATGVPTLLCLNLLVSVVATAFGGTAIRGDDVVLASGATIALCLAASALPSFPDSLLRGLTACALVAIALPRPPVPVVLPSVSSTRAGIAAASLVTGALTVWTATPGPITPVAMARGGRSGAEIYRSMQPISVVGYGAALAWGGSVPIGQLGPRLFAGLIAATLLGTGLGLALRPRIRPAGVILLIRIVAGSAALLLFASLLG